MSDISVERHYTPTEIAELWKVSADTVIRMFERQPGILVLGTASPNGRRRAKRMFRIPQTVLERVYRDRMAL